VGSHEHVQTDGIGVVLEKDDNIFCCGATRSGDWNSFLLLAQEVINVPTVEA